MVFSNRKYNANFARINVYANIKRLLHGYKRLYTFKVLQN